MHIRSPQTLLFIIWICFGLTAWSVVSVLQAYRKIRNWGPEANSVSILFQTWEKRPLQEATVADTDLGAASCGGDAFVLNKFEWPGSQSPPCVCPESASNDESTFQSSSESCTQAAIRAGCQDDVTFSSRDIVMWRNESAICGNTVAGNSRKFLFPAADGDFQKRPEPISGECPEGFKICGGVNSTDMETTCMPSAETCPLTKLRIVTRAEFERTKDQEQYIEFSNSVNIGGRYVLAKSRVSTGFPPIIGMGVGFQPPCLKVAEFRTYLEPGSRGTNSYHSECEFLDTTWEKVDELSEQELLSQTFLAEVNNPPGGTCHESNTGTGMLFGFDQCLSTDRICFEATRFTVCDKLVEFAETSSKQFGLYIQREPSWRDDCHTSPGDLRKQRKNLDSDGIESDWTLFVIVNICLNSLVGFVAPFHLLREIITNDLICCRGGKIAPRFSERHIIPSDTKLTVMQCLIRYLLNQWIVLVLCLGKLATSIFFTALLSNEESFWNSLGAEECGSESVNLRFIIVAEAIKKAFYWSLQVTLADSFHVCYSIAVIIALHGAVHNEINPEEDSD